MPAPADLFSEYRNFMTELEYCISVLRSRRSRGPVRIELALPAVLVIIKSSIVGASGNANLVLDSGGWVLVWVDLWFPLDTILFTPLSYGRENRALKRPRKSGRHHRAPPHHDPLTESSLDFAARPIRGSL